MGGTMYTVAEPSRTCRGQSSRHSLLWTTSTLFYMYTLSLPDTSVVDGIRLFYYPLWARRGICRGPNGYHERKEEHHVDGPL